MNELSPQVSIVIPCYKSAGFVSMAIESVLRQSGVQVELILIEDGVFDSLQTIIRDYGNKIRLITLANHHGAQIARNTGLQHVTAEYVLFLDSDDYIEGDLLLGLYEVMQETGASVAIGPCRMSYNDNSKYTVSLPPKNELPIDLAGRWLRGRAGPNPSSVLWRVSELKRIGAWNDQYIRNQDGELMIRAMLNGCTLTSTHRGEGVYVQHKGIRVSANRNDYSYVNNDMLDQYVAEWLEKNKDCRMMAESLKIFRFRMLVDAYYFKKKSFSEKYKNKWREKGGNLRFSVYDTRIIKIQKIFCLIFGFYYGVRVYYLLLPVIRLCLSLLKKGAFSRNAMSK